MHPAIVKTSQLILAGDIAGAENELTEYAEQEGDHALVVLLDEVPPRDLLALMREYDASKESVVNLLVTPEQFAQAVVLEVQYGDRNGDKLRGMMNAVVHRDGDTACEYLAAIGETEGGIGMLADYFADRYDELFSFVSSGQFTVQFNPEIQPVQRAATFMENTKGYDLKLIASLQPGAKSLKTVLARFREEKGRAPQKVLWLVGPEGDFTPAEMSISKNAGFEPITLGPLVLRCETAAVYALSILSYELQNG